MVPCSVCLLAASLQPHAGFRLDGGGYREDQEEEEEKEKQKGKKEKEKKEKKKEMGKKRNKDCVF